ncbi:MAG: SDR family oxidoreductase [Clostridiales bacterium]|nr:SDR family oxidoreductase [Clostridiales bacterium]
MRDLMGKVVVVVGASGGMGQAICKQLSNEGVRLGITSKNEPELLKSLEQELINKGLEVVSDIVDVTKEDEVKDFFATVKNKFGKIDILINLPGISIPAKISEMTMEQYNLTMDINVMGPFLCSKHFIPCVDAEAGGLIINVSSMAGKRANPNAPLYCTAKAALNMFSDGMAMQIKENNIKVTTLSPGGTDTGFWGDRKVNREKFLKADDVADVMLFVMKSNNYIVFHDIAFESFMN